jgi:hypothetical protein
METHRPLIICPRRAPCLEEATHVTDRTDEVIVFQLQNANPGEKPCPLIVLSYPCSPCNPWFFRRLPLAKRQTR